MHFTTTTLLTLATAAVARTDLKGCTTVNSVATAADGSTYATAIWFVPGTLEVCSIPDCGGGRAPAKKDVPGCPQYTGSASITPAFLPWNPLETGRRKTSSADPATSTSAASHAAVDAIITSSAHLPYYSSVARSVADNGTTNSGASNNTASSTDSESSTTGGSSSSNVTLTTKISSTSSRASSTSKSSSTASASASDVPGAASGVRAMMGSVLVAGAGVAAFMLA